jgi:hypothetical protein
MRPFFPVKKEIARRILLQVMSLSDVEVSDLLKQVLGEFENRHEHVELIFNNRYLQVQRFIGSLEDISVERQTLIGSYFSHEYSPESAALFNPSIVLHPDQTGLPSGSIRFILSLRATGEGHISSITFEQGM